MATTVDDVVAIGGEVAGSMVHVVQHVDLRTGRASVAHHLPIPLGHSAAVRLGDRVLLVGGRTTGGRTIGRMWWFRPEISGFTAAGRLPTPLADAEALSAGNTACPAGGERPAFSEGVLRLQWGQGGG